MCSEPSHLTQKKMATTSPQLLWQVLKKGSAFFVKGRSGDRPIFSAEPGNLAAKHSYKYSGECWGVGVSFRARGVRVRDGVERDGDGARPGVRAGGR